MSSNKQDILNSLQQNQELIETIRSAYENASNNHLISINDASKLFDTIIRSTIKDLTASNISKSDNSWRSEQKSYFSGRGRQWVYIELNKMLSILDLYEEEDNYDFDQYRKNITRHGKAWARYSGSRISPVTNEPSAVFEIRYQGSKIPETKVVFVLSHNEAIELSDSDRLEDGKTPHQLNLEDTTVKSENKVNNNKKPSTKNKTDIKKEESEILDIDVSNPPATNNPDEWEDFLRNVGLNCDQKEEV